MERKNKNQISTILMLVGVLFVIVSGGIFVSRAWQYIPEAVKQFLLLAGAGGLFYGAHRVSLQGRLKKTETALYYLGVAALGFFTVSVLGGFLTIGENVNAYRLFIANAVILIPVLVRVIQKKQALDCIVFIVLLDSIFILAGECFHIHAKQYAVIVSVWLLLMACMDMHCQSSEELAGALGKTIRGSYLLHLFCLAPTLVILQVAAFWDEEYAGYALVSYVFLACAMFVTARARKTRTAYIGAMVALYQVVLALVTVFWQMTSSCAACSSQRFTVVVCVSELLLSIALSEKLQAREEYRTVALAFGTLAVLCQDFIDLPVPFIIEIYCGIIGIAIVLLGYIWYHKHAGIAKIQFASTCCIMVTLLLRNLECEELPNVLILGLVCLVMLVIAAMKNARSYVLLSAGVLTLLALYLTRTLWLSIAWWVYLFAAGVCLIIFAIRHERG